MPGRTLIIRPGLIVGPHDPTDRFTYWPHRIAQGGEVLAPGKPEYPIQFIDVRDLAEWTIRLVEANATGPYNATGPDYTLVMQTLLDECKAVSGSDARFTWVSDKFLLDENVTPWMGLPLWLPLAENPDMKGMPTVDIRKAIAAGLTFRPLAETVRDTLAWDATRPGDVTLKAGISREREAEILQAWHNRT
jgi:2'-hydroxyisoflavone reductase